MAFVKCPSAYKVIRYSCILVGSLSFISSSIGLVLSPFWVSLPVWWSVFSFRVIFSSSGIKIRNVKGIKHNIIGWANRANHLMTIRMILSH